MSSLSVRLFLCNIGNKKFYDNKTFLKACQHYNLDSIHIDGNANGTRFTQSRPHQSQYLQVRLRHVPHVHVITTNRTRVYIYLRLFLISRVLVRCTLCGHDDLLSIVIACPLLCNKHRVSMTRARRQHCVAAGVGISSQRRR